MKYYRKGSNSFPVANARQIYLMATASFTAFTRKDGERTSILGPMAEGMRAIRAAIPYGTDSIEIETSKSTEWEAVLYETKEELVNEKPMNVEVGMEKPLSMKEEMMRYLPELLDQHMRMHNEENDEPSFDEIASLDIDDDEYHYQTPDTMVDERLTQIKDQFLNPLQTEQITKEEKQPLERPATEEIINPPKEYTPGQQILAARMLKESGWTPEQLKNFMDNTDEVEKNPSQNQPKDV